jgi:hypothetical protein
MSTNDPDVRHAGDDDLVRLLDEELAADRRTDVAGHVMACPTCAERLDDLRAASGLWSEALAAVDTDIRVDDMARARALAAVRLATVRATPVAAPRAAAGSWPRVLRAAAVGAILLAAGFSARPVVAWIGERVASTGGEVAVVPTLPADQPRAGATISFQPAGELFRIEMARPQEAGVLTIEAVAADHASAQIVGGAAEAQTILVLPSGLQVDNGAASTASYRVLLPAGRVARVVVVSGGVEIANELLPNPGSIRAVDLAAHGARP